MEYTLPLCNYSYDSRTSYKMKLDTFKVNFRVLYGGMKYIALFLFIFQTDQVVVSLIGNSSCPFIKWMMFSFVSDSFLLNRFFFSLKFPNCARKPSAT